MEKTYFVSVSGVLLVLDKERQALVLDENGFCRATGTPRPCPCKELKVYGRCKEKVYLAGGIKE